jgi:hypothetical protein
MKNLVIVMAGDKSLHRLYAQNKSFELWVIYYGDNDVIFEEYKSTADRVWRAKGLKIELIRRVLLEQLYFAEKFDFEAYDFILLPDDDIEFVGAADDISRLFEICAQIKADVFQPAILNDFVSLAWESTKAIPGAFCHSTNIVEIMMHGFSGAAFTHAYLPAIHTMDFIRSGWGIEPIWKKIGEAHFRRSLNTFVIDAVSALHTKPIGGGSAEIHAIGVMEAVFVPQIHTNRMKTVTVYDNAAEIPLPSAPPPFAPILGNNYLQQCLDAGIANIKRKEG